VHERKEREKMNLNDELSQMKATHKDDSPLCQVLGCPTGKHNPGMDIGVIDEKREESDLRDVERTFRPLSETHLLSLIRHVLSATWRKRYKPAYKNLESYLLTPQQALGLVFANLGLELRRHTDYTETSPRHLDIAVFLIALVRWTVRLRIVRSRCSKVHHKQAVIG